MVRRTTLKRGEESFMDCGVQRDFLEEEDEELTRQAFHTEKKKIQHIQGFLPLAHSYFLSEQRDQDGVVPSP